MKDGIEEIEFVFFLLGSIEINLITYYFHVDIINEKYLTKVCIFFEKKIYQYHFNQVSQTRSSQEGLSTGFQIVIL
jgi:hypothetical protein